MRTEAFLWLTSILLLMTLFVGIAFGGGAPVIISWQNSKTSNNHTIFSINVSENVSFNITANQTIENWNWTLNGGEQNHNFNNWSHSFNKYGTYYINVSGSNSNGTTQTISWKVTTVLTIVDDTGYEAKISKKPEKIVSIAPSNTEILFAIGVGDRVKGVTDYCDYPPEMIALRNNGTIEIVGSYTKVNREKILNLSLGLILAAHGNDLDDIAFLRLNNFTVIALHPKNIEDVLKNIELVGKVCDAESNATALTSNLRARINAIAANTASILEHQKLRVFYVIWYPEMWTAGSGTFVDDIIRKAGGINIASKLDGWKIMNKESIVQENPEVIIISSMGAGERVYNGIINDSAIQQTNAYKTNRIYIIDDPNLIERPGPRIVEGLEKMYSLVEIEMLTPANQLINIAANKTTRICNTNASDMVLDISISANLTTTINLTKSFTPIETNKTLTQSLGKYFTINASSNLQNSLKYVTMKIYYTNSELSTSNLIETSLAIYWYNATASKWEKLENSGVNTKDVSSYSGYAWANVSHLSTYGISGNLAPTPAPTQIPSEGGGGGGGGAAPGEPYENIADTEVRYVLAITPNKQNTVAFRKSTHHILEISFAYSQVADEVSVTLEKLINSSLLANGTPPGVVFENVNIWVNVPNPSYMSNASIKLCVEKSWISTNNIDPKSIKLYRFKDGSWNKLSTTKISENETLIFYLASTPGFSPYAISGEKMRLTPTPTSTSTPILTPTPTPITGPAEVSPTPTPTPTKPAPGFDLIAAAIGVTIVIYLRKRRP